MTNFSEFNKLLINEDFFVNIKNHIVKVIMYTKVEIMKYNLMNSFNCSLLKQSFVKLLRSINPSYALLKFRK